MMDKMKRALDEIGDPLIVEAAKPGKRKRVYWIAAVALKQFKMVIVQWFQKDLQNVLHLLFLC